jgi:hypothetical protein
MKFCTFNFASDVFREEEQIFLETFCKTTFLIRGHFIGQNGVLSSAEYKGFSKFIKRKN